MYKGTWLAQSEKDVALDLGSHEFKALTEHKAYIKKKIVRSTTREVPVMTAASSRGSSSAYGGRQLRNSIYSVSTMCQALKWALEQQKSLSLRGTLRAGAH